MAGRGEIEDGEAPESEGDSGLGIDPGTRIVRTAMRKLVCHTAGVRAQLRVTRWANAEETRYSAHPMIRGAEMVSRTSADHCKAILAGFPPSKQSLSRTAAPKLALLQALPH